MIKRMVLALKRWRVEKRAALALAVGYLIIAGIVLGKWYYNIVKDADVTRAPQAWLTKRIECPTPEKFLVNYLTAVGGVPKQYYPDIVTTMYIVYYTSQRMHGNDDPFGFLDDSDDYGAMMEILSKATLSLYKVCVKDGFSFSKLVSVGQSIKKEHKQYYNEFLSKYHKEFYDSLQELHKE